MSAVFAILAAICFGAAVFNLHLGTINWLYLGLLLVAVHLAVVAAAPWWRGRARV